MDATPSARLSAVIGDAMAVVASRAWSRRRTAVTLVPPGRLRTSLLGALANRAVFIVTTFMAGSGLPSVGSSAEQQAAFCNLQHLRPAWYAGQLMWPSQYCRTAFLAAGQLAGTRSPLPDARLTCSSGCDDLFVILEVGWGQ